MPYTAQRPCRRHDLQVSFYSIPSLSLSLHLTATSHIFCIPCSEHLGLANAANHRVCPACRTALANPDDVVATQLDPTEDYKTSVLSGLSPTVIMECAGRGLAFWSYQSTQEM